MEIFHFYYILMQMKEFAEESDSYATCNIDGRVVVVNGNTNIERLFREFWGDDTNGKKSC